MSFQQNIRGFTHEYPWISIKVPVSEQEEIYVDDPFMANVGSQIKKRKGGLENYLKPTTQEVARVSLGMIEKPKMFVPRALYFSYFDPKWIFVFPNIEGKLETDYYPEEQYFLKTHIHKFQHNSKTHRLSVKNRQFFELKKSFALPHTPFPFSAFAEISTHQTDRPGPPPPNRGLQYDTTST